MTKFKRIIFKISGEALSDGKAPISPASAKLVCKQIADILALGVEVAVVVGGGNFWRGRTSEEMNRATADHIGMMATVMNALALGEYLTASGIPNKVVSAFPVEKAAETYFIPNAEQYLAEGKVLVLGGGTGAPYFSTDTTLTLRACELHADAIFLLKAVDGIYSADPKLVPTAIKYDEISYDKIIADNLKALDLTAVAMCKEFALTVVVVGKDEPNAIIRVLNGEKLGTIIK